MCGIYFCVTREPLTVPSDEITWLLHRRGPDSIRSIQKEVCHHPSSPEDASQGRSAYLTFVATVLSLRGDDVVVQPLVDEASGSLLCWNGEAWKIGEELISGNDAQAVFGLMLQVLHSVPEGSLSRHEAYEATSLAFKCAVRSISGPFSFLFYDARFERIFYGRDVLGRRSLLMTEKPGLSLTLSSICGVYGPSDWFEVEADGIYVLDLPTFLMGKVDADQKTTSQDSPCLGVRHISWNSFADSSASLNACQDAALPALNRTLPYGGTPALRPDAEVVFELARQLQASLKIRVQNVFNPKSHSERRPACIAILFSGGLDCTLIARMIHDILPKDCPVDLLNVAFENPRAIAAARAVLPKDLQPSTSEDLVYGRCPDRVTGLSSYLELSQVCPGRLWRFISIDIPHSETIAHRAQVISLMHPHNTEMDLSIAYALYFAARGCGLTKLSNEADAVSYVSPSRVVLSGLGADELFGGYTRHTTAFNRSGYLSLLNELEIDVKRLGKRNLGRDDRIISHWGREARYPYLDEAFVSLALKMPIWEKFASTKRQLSSMQTSTGQVAPDDPILEPGKHTLRLLAWKLGMRRAAVEKKRAIQFGARTARMGLGKTKGTQIISD